VDTSDPLAAFQAEIAAVEAEVAAAAEAEAGVGSGHTEDAGGPATPEELEFEDDDGTVYVWDGALRKYLPKDAGTAAAAAAAASGGGDAGAYDLEAMTFAADDEVLPTLAGAKAALAAAAGAEGVGEGEAAAATERKVGVAWGSVRGGWKGACQHPSGRPALELIGQVRGHDLHQLTQHRPPRRSRCCASLLLLDP
jgi:hypothetical protein